MNIIKIIILELPLLPCAGESLPNSQESHARLVCMIYCPCALGLMAEQNSRQAKRAREDMASRIPKKRQTARKHATTR